MYIEYNICIDHRLQLHGHNIVSLDITEDINVSEYHITIVDTMGNIDGTLL